MGWHGYWAGPGVGFWWIFPLLWVLFWGSLIVLGVWAIRRLSGRGPQPALDILKRRLAAGEISQDDYDRLRKTLQG
jgi:putative membrane protein